MASPNRASQESNKQATSPQDQVDVLASLAFQPNDAEALNESKSVTEGSEIKQDDAEVKKILKAEKRLVLKLDTLFLPYACLSILIKKIDQTNYKAAYTAGMREDLNLAGTNALNYFDIYYTIAYAIFIIPSVLLLMRFRPSILLPTLELTWGVLTGCMALTSNVKVMFAIRFLIGMCEASCWPCTTVLLLSWYTPKELAKRQSIYLSASYIGSMFTFAMQSAIYQTLEGKSGMAGWRWLFVINAIMTVVAASIGYFIIPDYPSTTKAFYLNPLERSVAYTRQLAFGKRTQSSTPVPVKPLLMKAARTMFSWKFGLLFLCYAPWVWAQQTNAYFNLFLDSLRRADGSRLYSKKQVTNIPIGAYGITVFTAIVYGILSDRLQLRWPFAVIINLVQLVSTIILSIWPAGMGIKMFAFLISFTTGANESMLMSWIGDVCKEDPTERAVVVGWALTLAIAGNASLPIALWPAKQAPKYKYGYKVATAFTCVSIIAIFTYRWLLGQEKKKEKEEKETTAVESYAAAQEKTL
ncbi:MFS general substrate transporter [Violaceomyces palustris]|uniref:MFS general substrate transporter n=1 Tax=Violaceomyces palustris TaxID=1673888 RepID=A0ACD0NNA5_9BASI|nr:MFS general substrate transporter [Violaceomyces palustris]